MIDPSMRVGDAIEDFWCLFWTSAVGEGVVTNKCPCLQLLLEVRKEGRIRRKGQRNKVMSGSISEPVGSTRETRAHSLSVLPLPPLKWCWVLFSLFSYLHD